MSYALITGASKGIGKCTAECLARRNYDLLLVARSEDLLQDLATEWREKYRVQVQYLVKDLTQPTAAREITEWVRAGQWPLQVLVNNAGYGLWGYFRELSGESQHHMLQINMMTLFDLTYDLLPVLSDHTPAYILYVGSMAGLQAMPSLSGYSASKAFVNTFSRALHDELKPLGISVTVLTPGSVDTNFVAVSGMTHMEEMAKKTSMTPEAVAEAAVRAMFKKKKQVTPGFSNRLASFGVKHMPKGWIEQLVASMYRKKG
jgi:short-subunit dehydrogenase